MSANIDAKKVVVEEIKQKISNAKTLVFVDYRGLTVEKDTAMRAEFRKNGAEYRVYKNRLVLRALNELGITGCDKYLEGTSAVAFGYDDETSAPRIVANTAKTNENFKIKFGVVNGQIVGENEIKELANIPSKEVLIARLLSMLTAPVRGMAIALSEIAKQKN